MTHKDLILNIKEMQRLLPIGKTCDIIEKKTTVGGRASCFYFIDGLIETPIAERLMAFLIGIKPEIMDSFSDAKTFTDKHFPYVEITLINKFDEILYYVLAGQTVFFVDGFSDAIALDLREYPSRSVSEPDKEKTLRGARDGFVETIIANTALIRRRVRDSKLVFEMNAVGKRSKTDVAIGYIEGLADEKFIKEIKNRISNIDIDSISMGQTSLQEMILKKSGLNPFPKVKYTERPDVAAANLLEGKIVIMVDNVPSCVILPVTFFDFIQQVEDFYFPPVVGGYIRVIRNLFFYLTIILLPLWVYFMNNPEVIPEWLSVIKIKDHNGIPVIVQLLILEFGIDGLRIASVNTPDSLSSSLSIVGALLLSEFAVKTGWFDADAILYMAVVALAAFAQPSMELTYAVKFVRVFLLILTHFFGLWGLGFGWIAAIIFVASNKTINKKGYLYPLYPFNINELKKILFRKHLAKKKIINQ